MSIRDKPSLVTRLTVVTALGFALAVSLIVGFAWWAARNVDQTAKESEAQFIAKGLHTILGRVPKEQESSTLWDDAVQRVRAEDQAWLADNAGVWIGEYFGHDEVYIVDPEDRPVYAMRDTTTLEPVAYGSRAALVQPLIEALRQEIASLQDQSDVSEDAAPLGVQRLVEMDGIPVSISIKPILATTGAVTVPGDGVYLHLSFRRVDRDVLREIEGTFGLSGLRVLDGQIAGDTAPVVPVTDEVGRIRAFLTWIPARPGLTLITQAIPGTLGALGVGGLLLLALLWKLRASAADLHASEAQTRFLAFHDTLTGLPNRALFEDRLDRALLVARRAGAKVALHLIDLDRFKHINDTRGHASGDEVIRGVAARLSGTLRETDTVARLGGDEFAVIQSDVHRLIDAETMGRRIIGVLEEPLDVFGSKLAVAASVGIVISQSDEHSREEMLRKADIALYEAKGRGRGRFEVFVGDMDEVVKRRRIVEDELRLALELGDQIKAVYQPLYSADGKAIIGAEALVRWDHPVQGRIPPDAFIGIAEERGLMTLLGENMLRQASTFALESGLPWVAVNVSPTQFKDDAFPGRVLQVLSETGLPADRLQLEITESVLLEQTTQVDSALQALRAAGVRIALDDFGTGYSSMSYLRRYAIDKLKIDRSFVAELGTSVDSDAIVRAMIGLARSLKLRVTAEGVETPEQLSHLASLGCHEMQGFLLSKPLSDVDMRGLLGRQAAPRSGVA